jgi:hypothetical protein
MMTPAHPPIAHGQMVTIDKSRIMERIKKQYGFKTNMQLAAFLGVSPQTISGWIRRNSIDYDLVFSKCRDMSVDFMVWGRIYQEPNQRLHEIAKEYYLSSLINDIPTLKEYARRALECADLLIRELKKSKEK